MEYNHEHKSERISWIRAVVLGANDGIVSTASLIIAVAASQAAGDNIFTVGMAGLVAGAMSMAAGEYVSVSSQTDIEKAELALEESHIQ
ncbi:MAG: VIT1/CCC1 transporter family protein, partial [Sinobacterium sp.]